MAYRARSSDIDIVAQGDWRDQRGIAADLHPVTDGRLIFLKTVVIARDRAGADVSIAADGHVAEIGEMVRLCAIADLGGLCLDESCRCEHCSLNGFPVADGRMVQ